MRVQRIPVKISKTIGSLAATGALALVALAAFCLTAPGARAADSVTLSDQPAIGVAGKVVGSKLTGSIHITYPADQQHFTTADIVVTGTCPAGSLVTIYDNNVIRATGSCSEKGTFAIPISLFFGKNILQAKAVTELNQGDLWSNIVTVYLDVPASCGIGQFRLIPVEGVLDGTPKISLMRHVITLGGTPPYKLTWAWGDGKTDVSTANAEGQTQLSHTYDSTGIYTIRVRAVDKNGAVASTQLSSVILNPAGVDLPGELLDYWLIALLALAGMGAYLWGRHRGRAYEQALQMERIRAALKQHSEQEAPEVKVSAAPGPEYVEKLPAMPEATTAAPTAPTAPAAPAVVEPDLKPLTGVIEPTEPADENK
jgi:hypothetical protein